MKKELLETINVVCENADLKQFKDLTEDLHLRNDIGLDSLNLAELTVRLEEQFGVDIFEDSIVSTVGEIMEKLNTTK